MLTMFLGNVQEWSVKASNRLDNYLLSHDNLKFTKSLPNIITLHHSQQREALFYGFIVLMEN